MYLIKFGQEYSQWANSVDEANQITSFLIASGRTGITVERY